MTKDNIKEKFANNYRIIYKLYFAPSFMGKGFMIFFGIVVLGLFFYMFYLNFSVRLAPSPGVGSQTGQTGLGYTFGMDLGDAGGCGKVKAKCTNNVIRRATADSSLVPSIDGNVYCVVQQNVIFCSGSSSSRFDVFKWTGQGWSPAGSSLGSSVPSFGGWNSCSYIEVTETLQCTDSLGKKHNFDDINTEDVASCTC